MGKTSLVDKVIGLSESESFGLMPSNALMPKNSSTLLRRRSFVPLQSNGNSGWSWPGAFLSRFVPKISFGTDPVNDFSISFELRDIRAKADEILQLSEKIAEAENIRIVVCIDEFQQIGEFEDSLEFQRLLRSAWQMQSHVSYCLYGSRKRLMEALFESQSNPFYCFGDILSLQRIGRSDWVEFIGKRFTETGKSISEELAGRIADMIENYPAYVQHLVCYMWLATGNEVREEMVNSAVSRMLDSYQPVFSELISGLTFRQKNFPRAMCSALEGGFSEQKNLERYRLGNSASVTRVKKSLIAKDLVTIEDNGWLVIADPVFKLWLNKRFWNV